MVLGGIILYHIMTFGVLKYLIKMRLTANGDKLDFYISQKTFFLKNTIGLNSVDAYLICITVSDFLRNTTMQN